MSKLSLLFVVSAFFCIEACGNADPFKSEAITAQTVAPEIGPAQLLDSSKGSTPDTNQVVIKDSTTKSKTAVGTIVEDAKTEVKEAAEQIKGGTNKAAQEVKKVAQKAAKATKEAAAKTAEKVEQKAKDVKESLN